MNVQVTPKKEFDHQKFQSVTAAINIVQFSKMNKSLENLGQGIQDVNLGIHGMRSDLQENLEVGKDISRTSKENLEVGKDISRTSKENLEVGKDISRTSKESLGVNKDILNATDETLKLQQKQELNKDTDKFVKNLAFDIKTEIENLKNNEEVVEVLLTVGKISETMKNNNITHRSVDDLEYKDIIVNIEKDLNQLEKEIISKLSDQDQEDLDLMYDIIDEDEEEKINEFEQQIKQFELSISKTNEKIESLEKKHETNVNTLKDLDNQNKDKQDNNNLNFDDLIHEKTIDILKKDRNLDIIDNINNDVLFTFGDRLLGTEHKFFTSKLMKTKKKVSILWLLFLTPLYFYKKYKIKEFNSESETFKNYDFSTEDKNELKSLIKERYSSAIEDLEKFEKMSSKELNDNLKNITDENPLILEQIDKLKKKNEKIQNENISVFHQKIIELKERINWEIEKATDLVKRRPYLYEFLHERAGV